MNKENQIRINLIAAFILHIIGLNTKVHLCVILHLYTSVQNYIRVKYVHIIYNLGFVIYIS